jgi:hypothetical protein
VSRSIGDIGVDSGCHALAAWNIKQYYTAHGRKARGGDLLTVKEKPMGGIGILPFNITLAKF